MGQFEAFCHIVFHAHRLPDGPRIDVAREGQGLNAANDDDDDDDCIKEESNAVQSRYVALKCICLGLQKTQTVLCMYTYTLPFAERAKFQQSDIILPVCLLLARLSAQ